MLSSKRQKRLEQRHYLLQSEWQLRSEKLKKMRKSLAIETSPANKFQLEQQTEDEEIELRRLETELDRIEQDLRLESSQPVAQTAGGRSSWANAILRKIRWSGVVILLMAIGGNYLWKSQQPNHQIPANSPEVSPLPSLSPPLEIKTSSPSSTFPAIQVTPTTLPSPSPSPLSPQHPSSIDT
jgi:hypothetical protein